VKSVRLFIAIKPEEKLLGNLVLAAAPLKTEPWASKVRWIDADNIHLTLRFLGNSSVNVIADLCAVLRSRLVFDVITYEINEIAVFPSPSRPAVIAALVPATDELTRLATELEEIVSGFGYRPQRKGFRGHLTLARCRRGFPRDSSIHYLIEPISGSAAEIVLYHSDTRPAGAVYQELARIGITC